MEELNLVYNTWRHLKMEKAEDYLDRLNQK
jgi:hypothetical protein